jgi:hypothetical protein
MKPLSAGLLLGSVLLAGCATTRDAYDWGRYDEMLYQSYKDVSKTENLRVGIEAHIAALEKSNSKVAPGLYAELGTLYLEMGDSDRAISLYAKERDAWPESKGLMDVMIASLERRRPGGQEVAQ